MTSPKFLLSSYLLGLIIGLSVVFVATWADMESAFYGFPRLASAGLGGFHCPILMTRNDTNTISLTVSNPTDSKISPSVKTMISTPLVAEEYLDNIELAPGESKKLEWTIGPGNIDLGQFIFAKALVYSAYPLPSLEDSCGVFIVNLPGNGKVIVPFVLIISLLGMGWGLYGINKVGVKNEWVMQNVRSFAFVGIVVALGILTSITSGWVPSILLLAVALLMVFILLGSFIMNERRKE